MPVLKSPYVADLFGWQPDELEKALLGEVILDWQDWDAAIRRQAPDETTGRAWAEGTAASATKGCSLASAHALGQNGRSV